MTPASGWGHRLPPARCPHCARVVDAATPLDPADEAPPAVTGCATLCVFCGGLALFTTGLALRAPTAEEEAELLADERVAAAMALRRAYWAARG